MPNVGPLEIIIVLVLVLVIFGPKRLPELGRSLGRGIREFRGSVMGEHDDDSKPPTLDKGADASAPAQPTSTPAEQEQKAGEQ